PTGRDGVDLPLVEIDAGDLEPGFGEFERERETDVAEPDHAAPRLAASNLLDETLHGNRSFVTGISPRRQAWRALRSPETPPAGRSHAASAARMRGACRSRSRPMKTACVSPTCGSFTHASS